MDLENPAPLQGSVQGSSPLEALLAGAAGNAANFPAMLDIPPDADDETMVELAIALSLQDQVLKLNPSSHPKCTLVCVLVLS